MASPKLEVFALFDPTTGLPVTGATPTFTTYKNTSGTNLAQPAISEIGGGFYAFTPVFADLTKGIVYIVVSGTSRQWRYARPEDWNDDGIPAIDTKLGTPAGASVSADIAAAAASAVIARKIHTNHWKIFNNQLVIYDDDGSTPLYTFNLFDDVGAPSMNKIYERTPV